MFWNTGTAAGRGGAGAAFDDDGTVRGETAHNAKDWVVRGWTNTAGRLIDWQWARFE